MQKYHIDEADLSDNKLEEFEFKYHNEFERKLLDQIMYKVIGSDFLKNQFGYSWGKGSRSISGIRCTKAEGIQIGIEYEFYTELWKEEQEFFFGCFIQKHSIFQMDKDKRVKTAEDKITDEERLRMAHAMIAMQDKTIQQRLDKKSSCR